MRRAHTDGNPNHHVVRPSRRAQLHGQACSHHCRNFVHIARQREGSGHAAPAPCDGSAFVRLSRADAWGHGAGFAEAAAALAVRPRAQPGTGRYACTCVNMHEIPLQSQMLLFRFLVHQCSNVFMHAQVDLASLLGCCCRAQLHSCKCWPEQSHTWHCLQCQQAASLA